MEYEKSWKAIVDCDAENARKRFDIKASQARADQIFDSGAITYWHVPRHFDGEWYYENVESKLAKIRQKSKS